MNTKVVTVIGLVLAVAAVLADPATVPVVETLLGAHAATKLAALGALVSALGRGLFEKPKAE